MKQEHGLASCEQISNAEQFAACKRYLGFPVGQAGQVLSEGAAAAPAGEQEQLRRQLGLLECCW